ASLPIPATAELALVEPMDQLRESQSNRMVVLGQLRTGAIPASRLPTVKLALSWSSSDATLFPGVESRSESEDALTCAVLVMVVPAGAVTAALMVRVRDWPGVSVPTVHRPVVGLYVPPECEV